MSRPLVLASLAVCATVLAPVHLGAEREWVRSAVAQVETTTTSGPTAGCVTYSQRVKKQGMQFVLKNRCKKVEMQCSVSWKLRCDGDKKPRPSSSRFTLMPTSTEVVDASAAVCGTNGWRIRDVRWNCQEDS